VGLFSSKSVPVLGIDVSSTAVKLLELSGGGNKYKVECYAVEPLPSNSVVEKNITDVEAVGETIRRAVKRSGTKNKFAALAVAGSAVITKMITMPGNISEDEMASQISTSPMPWKRSTWTSRLSGPASPTRSGWMYFWRLPARRMWTCGSRRRRSRG